jgi:DNA-binding NtrC family response regulator
MVPADARPQVLVIDDEPSLHDALRELLDPEFEIRSALTAEEGVAILRAERFRCILLDLTLPGMDGLTFLRRFREQDGHTPVIVLTATRTVQTAVRAMRLGAEDYITKPWEPDELRLAVARAVERADLLDRVESYEAERARPVRFSEIVSRNAAMRAALDLARRMSGNDSRVLITGETGTGKELLARAIHDEGSRRGRPFIAVNCAAVPAELAESEFFGHERGAFTGALRSKRGWFELAGGGTLFLDEVTCLPLDLQAKLLRVLQDGVVRRVGSEAPVRADVRILSATNRDIRGEVAAGRFREDLFYRLNVVPLHIPALRERPEDIPELMEHFRKAFNRRFHKNVQEFSEECRVAFTRYAWPGNVRELEHTVERLVILATGPEISTRHLPMDLVLAARNGECGAAGGTTPLREARERFEREYILNVMVSTDWNQSRAAAILGLNRNTLIAKLHQFKLIKNSEK